MCGIAGIIQKNRNAEQSEIELMTDALQHRGPDGQGSTLYQNVAIGHRRLSIIDLNGGKQPLSNEDETIWITFNGEIYNFIELRDQLLLKGHIFHTMSDTEVIVHAYEEWGTECVMRLRGMFAFAILDSNKRELFIARDHFGIKPLVYGFSDQVFCFASEIQALRKVGGMEWTVNLEAVDQYLQFQYIPAPNTIYNNVFKLPPAHYIVIDFDGQIKTLQRYWELKFQPLHGRSVSDWEEELTHLLKESVRAHLVSDVPFGAFLSGGIDSSLVVGMMAEQMQQPVKTFSIGFKEKQFNELDYARMVSKRWNTEHHEEIVEPDALSILPELVRHYGEPFGDSSAIPTWYVSRLARKHVTMVLTGDAGDEIFAGYQSYTSRWSKNLKPIPEHLSWYKRGVYALLHKVKPQKYSMRNASLEEWLKNIHYCNDSFRSGLWKPEIQNQFESKNRDFLEAFFQQASNFGHFQKAQSLDFNTYLPGDILTKVDVASMMHSLETRTPLLDIKVVEFAAQIPESYNINRMSKEGWKGKLLLKQILKKYYPSEFIHRPKMGFGVPLSHWFGVNGTKRNEVQERLLDRGNEISEIFDRNSLEAISSGNNAGQQWLLLFLHEWFSQQN
jgi:asparagine synthase (glutamine-hydrolysing)